MPAVPHWGLRGVLCAAEQPPAPPAPEIQAFIGEYGTRENIFEVYEDGGLLHAEGKGMGVVSLTRVRRNQYRVGHEPIRPVTELRFISQSATSAGAVELGGELLPRHDFGAEVESQIQAGVRADAAGMRAAALAATPPVEAVPRKATDLVVLATIDQNLRFDIRYATRSNFMGIQIYECPGALMQRPAALALSRVQRSLRSKGLGLTIFDAYRPWFATKMFWDATPPASHEFVADPAQGSRHNRGCAVDLTLHDLRSGRQVDMPSRYDEMSRRAYPDYRGGTSRQRWFRGLLRHEMERERFTVYPQEWWHFDYRDWPDYGIGRASFTELAACMR